MMMAHLYTYGFLAQALLAFQAFAARISADEALGTPPLKSVLSSRSNTVCGGQEIWKMMTHSTTVGSIQQIKWAEVLNKADEYISEQNRAAQRLASELKHLQERIDAKRRQESKTVMTLEHVTKLVTSGLSDFGGLEGAQRTKCGHPSVRNPRAPREAYRQSRSTFNGAAASAFDGTVRLDGDAFSEVCTAMLPCTDRQCYCSELCQDFRDMAQDLSDSTAGTRTGASSDQLLKEYSEQAKEMQFHTVEAEQCKQDKEHIVDFSQQIDVLKDDIKEKFSRVQDAEFALDDVMWDITEVEDALKDEESYLDEALQILKQSVSVSEAAKGTLDRLKGKESTLLQSVTTGQATLKEATLRLGRAKNANRVVTLLKSAVSTTMLRMALYFEVAVQKPVRFIGWDESLSLDKHFHKDPMKRSSGVAVKEAVSAMEGHCMGTALQAFSEVAQTVDLRPLCNFGKADDILDDISKAVAERTASIREQIEIVKSWLDPYKGQNITKAQVKEYITAGEPEGLREIISVYGDTKFFSYLQRWTAGGEMLQLINKLGEAITSMDTAVQKAQQMLEGLQAELKNTVTEREEAAKQLEAAASKVNQNSEEAAKLEKIVKELQEKSKDMSNLYDSLKKQVEEATAKWEAAKTNLVKSHQQATSFLQAIESESLEVLQQRDAAAAAEVSRLERALSQAQNSQELMAMDLRRLENSAHRKG